MSENTRHSTPALPGSQLRQLRVSNHQSLNDLAAKTGSSPSAIHRYESGWGGFELRTLARIAAALGARLEVSLIPVCIPTTPPTREAIAQRLRPLFWDVDLTPAHLDQYPEWVLRRVLQFGDWESVHEARLYFGDDAFRAVARHRSLDARTRHFWEMILGETPP